MNKEERELKITESRNPKTMNLDNMTSLEIATVMNEEDFYVIEGVKKVLPPIAKVIDFAAESITNGGRLIYLGAGTSGRLGVLDASECPPTFGVSNSMVIGLIAGGKNAIWQAIEGAEDSETQCVDDLEKIDLNNKDTVIGLAASGSTPYVLYGLKYAKSIGCHTASIACNENTIIGKEAEVAIEVIVGPEILTGSTRLKSGTAQKMILNMISTGAMIRAGYVYQNLMVNLQATNNKLHNRAINIVKEATETNYETSQKALINSNGDVKVAIVSLLLNTSIERAKKVLDDNKGNIRKAIEETR